MNIILMEHKTDCEVAALATACQVSYDDAETALGWRKLVAGLESPIMGNPINLYRALLRLGFWKKNITLTDLLEGKAPAMKTVMLAHNPDSPILQQHWCVYGGRSGYGQHLLLWGDSESPKVVSDRKLEEFFRRGFPNCAFAVYKANIFTLIWNKIRMLWS